MMRYFLSTGIGLLIIAIVGAVLAELLFLIDKYKAMRWVFTGILIVLFFILGHLLGSAILVVKP